jgi:hypothetical protein
MIAHRLGIQGQEQGIDVVRQLAFTGGGTTQQQGLVRILQQILCDRLRIDTHFMALMIQHMGHGRGGLQSDAVDAANKDLNLCHDLLPSPMGKACMGGHAGPF